MARGGQNRRHGKTSTERVLEDIGEIPIRTTRSQQLSAAVLGTLRLHCQLQTRIYYYDLSPCISFPFFTACRGSVCVRSPSHLAAKFKVITSASIRLSTDNREKSSSRGPSTAIQSEAGWRQAQTRPSANEMLRFLARNPTQDAGSV